MSMRAILRFVSWILVIGVLAGCQAQPSQSVPVPTSVPGAPLPAAQTARVWVEPAKSTLAVGQTASVTVQIDNVQGLAGFELHLTYDPAILDVQDADASTAGVQVALGNFLAPDFIAFNQAGKGKIDVAVLQLPPSEPVSGNGPLIAFTVKAQAPGDSALTLETVLLADKNAASIPVRTENGQVIVK
jgi:Cohesin domain